MYSDGIKYLKHKLDATDEALLVPISDCHIGASFDEEALRDTFRFISERDNSYVIFNGDLINVGLPDTVDDEWFKQEPLSPQEQLDLFVHIVQDHDITDKILGIVGGSNHHQRAKKRFMHDYDLELAERLNLKPIYAKDGVALKLEVGYDTSKNQTVYYFIYATHGWTGGRRPGSAVNGALDLALSFPLTDVFVVSHSHLRSCHVDNYVLPSTRCNRLIPQERHYVTSGAFLNWGGYAQRKGMRMLGTGAPLIRLKAPYRQVRVEL
jgi:predicted MPP superfamily phosphohydrolase